MELKVTTRHRALADEMLQKNGHSQPPKDVSVQFKGIEFKKTLDAPEIAAFIVTVTEHIPAILAADLIMAWVMGRFYNHRAEIESITIDETKITFSKSGKMRKVIRRKIKKERRQ